MDAAVAGIVGALAGGLLGAGGAIGAGIVSARGQSRGTHQQWLRTVRRDAYREFLLHASELLDIIVDVADHLVERRMPEAAAQLATFDEEPLRRAVSLLELEAPPEVLDKARQVLGAFRLAIRPMQTESSQASGSTSGLVLLRDHSIDAVAAFKQACTQDLQRF